MNWRISLKDVCTLVNMQLFQAWNNSIKFCWTFTRHHDGRYLLFIVKSLNDEVNIKQYLPRLSYESRYIFLFTFTEKLPPESLSYGELTYIEVVVRHLLRIFILLSICLNA